MAAGDRLHLFAGIRLISGEAFPRRAVVDIRKGIEDKNNEAVWTQVESVSFEWKDLQRVLGTEDLEVLLRLVEKVETAAAAKSSSLQHSILRFPKDMKPD